MATPYPQPPSSTAPNAPNGPASADNDTAQRIVQGAHEVVDRIAGKAMPAVEKARAGIDEATDALRARGQQLGELQTEWTESTREHVRAHPLTSVLAAFAAGLVVSRLLR